MIIYNEIDKEITFPKGIGNTPEGYECPVLNEICITENGEFDGYFDKVIVNVPDLNGSYDDGYSQGYSDGNDNGYNDGFINGKIEGTAEGKQEQKSLMVRTNITRNAVYSREDGYNEVEVNVQPETDILNITENGIYKTNISENNDFVKTATGFFDDGTPFFNYAKVTGSFFVTNLYPKADSKIEVWFNNISFFCNIVGNRIISKKKEEFTITNSYSYPNNQYFEKDVLVFGIGGNYYGFENADKWKHIEMSVSNGIWINGVKYADVDVEYLGGSTPFCICNDSIQSSYSKNELFIGMVKIDGKTFIPTAEGFIDYETKELLEKCDTYGGEYEFFNVEQTINEKPFRTVFVDVQPKINVAKEKIKFAYSSFTEIPDYFDFSDVTDMSYIFKECENLKTIPKIDSSNVTNLNSAFYYCQNLRHIDYLDTSNVVDMQYTFGTCTSLKSLCALNVPKLVVPSSINVFGSVDLNKFTDFGGFINLKTSLSNNNNLKRCPNLTYESCMNIINGLYDFIGNGETPNSSQGVLSVHQNFLNLVGQEGMDLAAAKGWSILV